MEKVEKRQAKGHWFPHNDKGKEAKASLVGEITSFPQVVIQLHQGGKVGSRRANVKLEKLYIFGCGRHCHGFGDMFPAELFAHVTKVNHHLGFVLK
jgi:hypothetical protein